MHIVIVSLHDSTQTMSVQIINTNPSLASQMLHIAIMHTTESSTSPAHGRTH
jgi:hypothetical protein